MAADRSELVCFVGRTGAGYPATVRRGATGVPTGEPCAGGASFWLTREAVAAGRQTICYFRIAEWKIERAESSRRI